MLMGVEPIPRTSPEWHSSAQLHLTRSSRFLFDGWSLALRLQRIRYDQQNTANPCFDEFLPPTRPYHPLWWVGVFAMLELGEKAAHLLLLCVGVLPML